MTRLLVILSMALSLNAMANGVTTPAIKAVAALIEKEAGKSAELFGKNIIRAAEAMGIKEGQLAAKIAQNPILEKMLVTKALETLNVEGNIIAKAYNAAAKVSQDAIYADTAKALSHYKTNPKLVNLGLSNSDAARRASAEFEGILANHPELIEEVGATVRNYAKAGLSENQATELALNLAYTSRKTGQPLLVKEACENFTIAEVGATQVKSVKLFAMKINEIPANKIDGDVILNTMYLARQEAQGTTLANAINSTHATLENFKAFCQQSMKEGKAVWQKVKTECPWQARIPDLRRAFFCPNPALATVQ